MSITYYCNVEIFFTVSTSEIDATKSISASCERARSTPISTPRRATKNFHRAIVALKFLTRDVDLNCVREEVMVQLLLTEQRREDPLIVTLDSVERQHGISSAATRNSHEWTSRIVGKR